MYLHREEVLSNWSSTAPLTIFEITRSTLVTKPHAMLTVSKHQPRKSLRGDQQQLPKHNKLCDHVISLSPQPNFKQRVVHKSQAVMKCNLCYPNSKFETTRDLMFGIDMDKAAYS